MNKKYLIIAFSVLLIISLSFGFSITKAFDFFSTQVTVLGKLANSVSEITGGDTDSYIPIYVSDLNQADLGSYYDEYTDTLYLVKDVIKQYLPNWLRVADTDQCSVKVFPTYYSISLNSVYSTMNINVDPNINNPVPDTQTIKRQRYSINRAIRLYITYYDDERNVNQNYDVYMFYDYVADKVAFFCTSDSSYIGYKSYRLDSITQYRDNILNTSIGIIYPLLNKSYKVQLHPSIAEKDTLFNKYLYDTVTDIQNTTDPLWLYLGNFIKE